MTPVKFWPVPLLFSVIAMAPAVSQSDNQGLERVIKLDGSAITVSQFAEQFAKQAGVTITFPDHLKRRRLQIASDQAAKVVLSALCDLEGWTWTPRGDSGATIEAPTQALLRGETVHVALRRLFPPDLTRFLRLPVSNTFNPASAPSDQYSQHETELRRRISAALNQRRADLLKGIRLSEIKPSEVELVMLAALLSHNVMSAMGELNNNSSWLAARPENVEMRLDQGALLLFDCDLPGRGVSSFGARVVE